MKKQAIHYFLIFDMLTITKMVLSFISLVKMVKLVKKMCRQVQWYKKKMLVFKEQNNLM